MTEDFNPPSAKLTSPPSGANVRGLVTVAASAWDDIGIRHVYFLANGTEIGLSTISPYKILWNTTGIANGPVQLEAHAVDTSGNESLPSIVHVMVANMADTSPPVPMVSYPDDGEVVEGIVTIKGVATDNVGVTGLHIEIDGRVVHSITDAARISYNWDTGKVQPGEHVIAIVANDAAGNVGTASVRVKK